MAIVKFSGIVDEIQGKLNGSVFRTSGGLNLLQNKRYRSPRGFVQMGRNAYSTNEPVGMINRLIPLANSYIARNGVPFETPTATIQDRLAEWAWQDFPYRYTELQAQVLWLAIAWYFGQDPAASWYTSNAIVTAAESACEVIQDSGELFVHVYNEFAASWSDVYISMSNVLPGRSYFGRGRMARRSASVSISETDVYFTIPSSLRLLENPKSSSISFTLQPVWNASGYGIGPATAWQTVFFATA